MPNPQPSTINHKLSTINHPPLKSKILITGGAGYIATHTLIELAKENHEFIVYDNLSNSSAESLKRVEKIIGKSIEFIKGDIRDTKKLKEVFQSHKIDSVIHFAGLKAVGESVEKPLEYYDNNVVGTLRLLEVMKEFECKKIVFSSSATVYGDPEIYQKQSNIKNPSGITEDYPVGGTTNPYGTSKYMIERILEDLYISDNTFKIAILRYFNPVGAHESGTIGEDPKEIPNNLMPYISQVAVGKREHLNVFGNDYDTHDGTGVRDYIHVVDLAQAHVKALNTINQKPKSIHHPPSTKNQNPSTIHHKPLTINLGTGNGYSVLDMVKAFEKASGKKIPYKITPRRAGDIATCYANPSHAKETLGWQAKKTLEDMCKDTWNWQSKNPNGF
ncbi:MAG: UDP-glucose 4-epimerase GalE [Sphaerochaetaceae bacterium]|nr:UDP-glucose 4-epimerase GalE [Sphaerochaetaceae bacterium]